MSTPPARITAPRTHADREIPSDGLTLDTPIGPADLVVAQRLLQGQPCPATLADTQLAYTLAKGGAVTAARPIARALGVTEGTAKRGIDRARSRTRRDDDTAVAA